MTLFEQSNELLHDHMTFNHNVWFLGVFLFSVHGGVVVFFFEKILTFQINGNRKREKKHDSESMFHIQWYVNYTWTVHQNTNEKKNITSAEKMGGKKQCKICSFIRCCVFWEDSKWNVRMKETLFWISKNYSSHILSFNVFALYDFLQVSWFPYRTNESREEGGDD